MSTISIRMFGKFEMYLDEQRVECFKNQKALELFCFLMIFRDRSHNREHLADLFFGDHPTADSKKYLRKTLWQLQSGLEHSLNLSGSDIILVEQDWLRFAGDSIIWMDVLEFEHLLAQVGDQPGQNFDQRLFLSAQMAENLYRGDLLEGWYQDWCIYERERIKDNYIALVDKLMAYCEANSDLECGIRYGKKLLMLDRARENTYQRLIRLYLNLGDRTSALRQYEACKEALKREFDIEPGVVTQDLFRQIRSGSAELPPAPESPRLPIKDMPPGDLQQSLLQLNRILLCQTRLYRKMLAEIKAIRESLKHS